MLFPASTIPITGNKTMGISEVAASGIASVAQNIAIRPAIAAILETRGLLGSKSAFHKSVKTIGAKIKPRVLKVTLFFSFMLNLLLTLRRFKDVKTSRLNAPITIVYQFLSTGKQVSESLLYKINLVLHYVFYLKHDSR